MKEKFKAVMKRVHLFLKEILNVLGNVLVPLVSLVVLIMEILPVPTTWVEAVKKVEYWFFYASGTGERIEKIIEENVKKLEEKSENGGGVGGGSDSSKNFEKLEAKKGFKPNPKAKPNPNKNLTKLD